MSNIVLRHSFSREPSFKPRAHPVAAQFIETPDCLHRLFFRLNDETGDSFVDDFRYRAGSKGDDRRPAGHRFDHDQAEGFGPVDGKKQRRRACKKLLLCSIVDLTDKPDILAINLGLQSLLKIASLCPRQLRCNPKRHSCGASDPNCSFGTLIGSEPPEERKVVSPFITRLEQIGRKPMVDRP